MCGAGVHETSMRGHMLYEPETALRNNFKGKIKGT